MKVVTKMINIKTVALCALLTGLPATALLAQQENGGVGDTVSIKVTRARSVAAVVPAGTPAAPAFYGPHYDIGILPHPVHVEARHPKPGCHDTAVCGEVFFSEDTHNIRVSAGTTWQSQIMGSVSAPTNNVQANYLGLTNTAITPAMADTTLSGLITSNGLSCAQGTYTDGSGVISVPGTVTVSIQGSAGAVSYWYWVLAGGQGIYTTLSAAGTTTTANATLSASNYAQVSWAPVAGATTYYVFRTTSSSAPSGATTSVAGRDSSSQPTCTATTCYVDDVANTLAGTSITIPASNLTNYGHFTLVHTWTATATQSAQAFGVFGNSACTSLMFFEGTFTQVSLNNNDTFALTETIQFGIISWWYLTFSLVFGVLFKLREIFRARSSR